MDAAFQRVFFFSLGTYIPSHELYQNLQYVLSNVKHETINGLREETVIKFRLAGIQTRNALPVQHFNQLSYQTNWELVI